MIFTIQSEIRNDRQRIQFFERKINLRGISGCVRDVRESQTPEITSSPRKTANKNLEEVGRKLFPMGTGRGFNNLNNWETFPKTKVI